MKYFYSFMKKKYMSYIMANKPQFVWGGKNPQWRTFIAVFTVTLTLTLSEEHKEFPLPEKLFQQMND
jgi:hypothetical protein